MTKTISCSNSNPPPPPKGLPSISDRISSLQLAVRTTRNKSPSFQAKMLSMGGRQLVLPSPPPRKEKELHHSISSSSTSPSDPAGIRIETFDEVSSITTNSNDNVLDNAGGDDSPMIAKTVPTSKIFRCFRIYNKDRRESGKTNTESHAHHGEKNHPDKRSTDNDHTSNKSRKAQDGQNWILFTKTTAHCIANCCYRSCCGCFHHCCCQWWWW